MSYAGNQEDVWIASHFPPNFRGFACEVGAYDGRHISNTLLLEEAGWDVLCIEPNPVIALSLEANRKRTMKCACDDKPGKATFYVHRPAPDALSSLRPCLTYPAMASTMESYDPVEVEVKTLDACLAEAGFSRLDALSVDTEGTELDVLKGFTIEKWRPRVLVIESWNDPSPVDDYLAERGYTRAERRNPNNLYVRA